MSVTWVSSAKLQGLSLVHFAARENVVAALPPELRSNLQAFPDVPPDLHPVVLELWNIRQGRLQVDGRGQQEVWGDIGAMVGVLGAAWVGTATSLIAGRAGRAALQSAVGSGARLGARASTRLSSFFTEPFANYREVMVAVPGVNHPGTETSVFVAQMWSDSLFAVTGARVGGYGYNKVLAHISARENRWVVADRAGQTALDVSFRVEPGDSVGDDPRRAALLQWFKAPLLGRTDGAFGLSLLERRVDDPEVRFATASGTVAVGLDSLIPHAATGAEKPTLHGIAYSGLPARVSRATRLPSVTS